MKKLMFAAAVAAGLAAFGEIQSANTVGYETKQAASAGTLMLAAIQFDEVGGTTMDVSKAVVPSVAPAAYDENSDYAYDENWYKSTAQIQIRSGSDWTVLYYTSCGSDPDGNPVAGWATPEDGAVFDLTIGTCEGFWLTDPNGFSFMVKNPVVLLSMTRRRAAMRSMATSSSSTPTFTVTYRAKDGALREERVEAASRAEHTSRCLRRRKPCRRTADCTAINGHERVGQTASFGKTRRNVAVERRVAAEFVADMGLRIEYDYGFHCRIPYYAEGWREVGIARNEHKCVSSVFVGVFQHFGCKIDVCQLFRYPCASDEPLALDERAGLAGVLRSFKAFYAHSVVSLNYRYALARQCVNVFILSIRPVVVASGVYHPRSEIFDRLDLVFGNEEFLGECAEIKPLVRSMTEQPVVQVTPVNIHDCPLVCHKKVLGSWRTRTPRRLPESRRVKRPVIGGVGKCIKIRAVTQ